MELLHTLDLTENITQTTTHQITIIQHHTIQCIIQQADTLIQHQITTITHQHHIIQHITIHMQHIIQQDQCMQIHTTHQHIETFQYTKMILVGE